jgi:hypothetical protein
METAKMKSLSILGLAICIMTSAAVNTTALAEPKAKAESLGYQCRAAVRAELREPDCRMALPPGPNSHCNVPSNGEVELMDNKINECVRRGGPGRQAKAGT